MSNKEELATQIRAEEKVCKDDDGEKDCDDDCQFIFPQRLMSILSDDRNSDSICWLPHGRAFIIRNRKLFAEKVMPKFFPRKSKYSSFTRKLNRWNFVRVSSGPELGAYYHEFFLRDKPYLAAQMFCKNARTKIAMASPDPKPTALVAESQMMQTQKLGNQVDPAQMFLMRQQLDPSMQLLLEQQLSLCQQQVNPQQQQLGLQNQVMNNILQGAGSSASASLALHQQMQLQKQQQERMLQLQQLMSLNLQSQQQSQKRRNNFRASAA